MCVRVCACVLGDAREGCGGPPAAAGEAVMKSPAHQRLRRYRHHWRCLPLQLERMRAAGDVIGRRRGRRHHQEYRVLKRARERVVPTGPDKAAAAGSLQRDLRRLTDAEQVFYF